VKILKTKLVRFIIGVSSDVYSIAPDADAVCITNDGDSNLTMTIGDVVCVLYPKEVLESRFEKFTQISIETTSTYRLMVLRMGA
jgi:hypothetical protein